MVTPYDFTYRLKMWNPINVSITVFGIERVKLSAQAMRGRDVQWHDF